VQAVWLLAPSPVQQLVMWDIVLLVYQSNADDPCSMMAYGGHRHGVGGGCCPSGLPSGYLAPQWCLSGMAPPSCTLTACWGTLTRYQSMGDRACNTWCTATQCCTDIWLPVCCGTCSVA
jgi:hypothetical protein